MNYDHMQGRPRAPSDVNGYASYESHGESRSPIAKSNTLNRLANDKKLNKDGQEQKRRGPKPDAKPALTRRQELNRQAQRTHRERKEQYIKTLERDLMKVREAFTVANVERDTFFNENRRLKDILTAHGIPFEYPTPSTSYNATMHSAYTGSTAGSMSGSYRQDSHTTTLSPSPINAQSAQMGQPMTNGHNISHPSHPRFDAPQAAVDFVLALEQPCAEHQQYLSIRAHNPEGQPHHHPLERADDMDYDHMSGHALMMTAPTFTHIMDKPAESYGHKVPDNMTHQTLFKLFEASALLPVDGSEITPIRAWFMVQQHEKWLMMDLRDIEAIKAILSTKVICFGFGAVCEEYHVLDAIETVLASKQTTPVMTDMAQYQQQNPIMVH